MAITSTQTILPIITNEEYEAVLYYAGTLPSKAELQKLIRLALQRRLFSSEQAPAMFKIMNNFIDYKVPSKVSYSYESLLNSLKTKLFLNSFASFSNKIDTKIESNSIVIQDFLKEVDHLKEEVSEYTLDNKKISTESKLLDYRQLSNIVEQYNTQIREFIPSGFKTLDENLDGGFRKTRIYLFIGRTGIGKSTLLRNIGWQLVRGGHPVLHITLEMTALETLVAYLPLIVNRPFKEIISNDLMKYEKEIKEKLSGKLEIAEFLSGEEAKDIKDLLLTVKTKPEVLLIDYLDCLTPTQDWTLVAKLMQDLKTIATEYNLSIITAAQFNRNADMDNSEMAFVAGGYDKVKKAETVILMKQNFQDKQSRIINLAISKNRWGKAGIEVKVGIDYNFLKMYDLNKNV